MMRQPDFTASPGTLDGAQVFLQQWVSAWNRRDAHALAELHTPDAMTINRYGTLIEGKTAAEEALSFLLGEHGPFGDAVFPPMQIVTLREIAPGVAVVQATWKAPCLAPDGKAIRDRQNEMILSYTLLKQGTDWKVTQIDGHNVEKMDLPYSAAEQRE